MLILSRRIGEQLLIGDDILVEVLEVSGEQVRLGIAAPSDVKILRDEVLEDGEEDLQWRGQTAAMVQSMSFIPHAVIPVDQVLDHSMQWSPGLITGDHVQGLSERGRMRRRFAIHGPESYVWRDSRDSG